MPCRRWLGGRGDVVDPAAPPIPRAQRGADDARAFRGDEDETRVPSREAREAEVVVAEQSIPGSGPQRAKRVAVHGSDLPDHHRRLRRL